MNQPFAPRSRAVSAAIDVSTVRWSDGDRIVLSVAGATVYLDAKATAALLADLCEAELKTFVTVSVQPKRG